MGKEQGKGENWRGRKNTSWKDGHVRNQAHSLLLAALDFFNRVRTLKSFLCGPLITCLMIDGHSGLSHVARTWWHSSNSGSKSRKPTLWSKSTISPPSLVPWASCSCLGPGLSLTKLGNVARCVSSWACFLSSASSFLQFGMSRGD
jgi:hypothetical protein